MDVVCDDEEISDWPGLAFAQARRIAALETALREIRDDVRGCLRNILGVRVSSLRRVLTVAQEALGEDLEENC